MTLPELTSLFNKFKEEYYEELKKYNWASIERLFYRCLDKKNPNELIMEIYAYLDIVIEDGFYQKHLELLKQNFDLGCNIIEVGAGMFPSFGQMIAKEQQKLGKGTVTLYDPLLLVTKPKYPNMTLKKESIGMSTSLKSYDLVVSILSCSATEILHYIVAKEELPFYNALCDCNHFDCDGTFLDTAEEYHERLIEILQNRLQSALEVTRLGKEYGNYNKSVIIYKGKKK